MVRPSIVLPSNGMEDLPGPYGSSCRAVSSTDRTLISLLCPAKSYPYNVLEGSPTRIRPKT